MFSFSIEKVKHVDIENDEFSRLHGHHFSQKISYENKQKFRSCKVCVPAERKLDKRQGITRKRPGRETSYQCKQCGVALCIEICFEIYYTSKDFV